MRSRATRTSCCTCLRHVPIITEPPQCTSAVPSGRLAGTLVSRLWYTARCEISSEWQRPCAGRARSHAICIPRPRPGAALRVYCRRTVTGRSCVSSRHGAWPSTPRSSQLERYHRWYHHGGPQCIMQHVPSLLQCTCGVPTHTCATCGSQAPVHGPPHMRGPAAPCEPPPATPLRLPPRRHMHARRACALGRARARGQASGRSRRLGAALPS